MSPRDIDIHSELDYHHKGDVGPSPDYYQVDEPTEKTLEDQQRAEAKTPLGPIGGVKYDKDKLPLDLVPPRVILAIAEILQYGTGKYAPRNWERGMIWSRPYAALMRHLLAWWDGEERDSESNLHHLHHALCNLAFLVEYTNTHTELDDRPILSKAGKKESSLKYDPYPPILR